MQKVEPEIKEFLIKLILFGVNWVLSIYILDFFGIKLEFNILGIPGEFLGGYCLALFFSSITIKIHTFLFGRNELIKAFLEMEEE